MKHAEAHELLHDFIDGQLPPDRHAAVAAHVAQCPACKDEITALRALLRLARQLPAERAPERDLWPQIAAQLGDRPQDAVAAEPRVRSWVARLHTFATRPTSWIPAAATAALVVLVLVLRPSPERDRSADAAHPARSSDAVVTAAEGPLAADEVTAALPLPASLAVIQALEEETRQHDHELQLLATADPEVPGGSVFAVIGRNLEVVNQAIQEAREAWVANPGCPQLVRLLTAAYRAKATLQGEAFELAAQHG